jgi:hypothetical protein
MATNQEGKAGRPLRVGWGVGLLTLAGVVCASALFPAAAVVLLGGSAGAGAAAMSGGLLVGMVAYIGAVRFGVRRGWWA